MASRPSIISEFGRKGGLHERPVSYLTMIEGKKEGSRFQLRVELVRFALREGIREAARVFRCSCNAVRVWVRRYEQEGISGLRERSRAPGRIPQKTSAEVEKRVVEV